MNKIFFIIVLILFILPINVNAQSLVTIYGRLTDKLNNPVQANITIFNQGTSTVNTTNQTDESGNYFLQIPKGTYDIRYDLTNYYISLVSFNITSNLINVLAHITTEEEKISFFIDVFNNQAVQVYSPARPNKIIISDSVITNDQDLVIDPSWKYENNLITIKFNSNNLLKLPIRGVKYNTQYGKYLTSDDVLRRDFALFVNNDLDHISLGFEWDKVETTQGVYNDSYLSRIRHVLDIANEFGLKVLLSGDIGKSEEDKNVPSYVIDPVTGKNMGLAIVRSSEMRQAFLNMYEHVVQKLSNHQAVHSWILLGEPWYYPHEFTEKWATEQGLAWNSEWANINQTENYLSLFEELSNIIKTYDPTKLKTINFPKVHFWNTSDGKLGISNIFEEDWSWDSRVFSSIDYHTWGSPAYPVPPNFPQLETQEQSDKLHAILKKNMDGVRERGKKVATVINAFSNDTDNDTSQLQFLKDQIEGLKLYPVDSMRVFNWNSQQNLKKNTNLCNDTKGTPRPAFYEIKNFQPVSS